MYEHSGSKHVLSSKIFFKQLNLFSFHIAVCVAPDLFHHRRWHALTATHTVNFAIVDPLGFLL